jgi:predicted amidophosphoribosyltransferase
MSLKKKERHQNIKDAFQIIGKPKLKNKTILLIDDVATTGLTLNEAAKTLRSAGARRIWGVVIAKD